MTRTRATKGWQETDIRYEMINKPVQSSSAIQSKIFSISPSKPKQSIEVGDLDFKLNLILSATAKLFLEW